jgi:hypothetical protein
VTTVNNSVVLNIFEPINTFSVVPSTGTQRQNVAPGTSYGITINDQTIGTAGVVAASSGTQSPSTTWSTASIILSPSSGTPSFVAASFIQSAYGTSLSTSVPTGTVSGNIVIACVESFNNAISAPSGFTQLFQQKDASNNELTCFTKTAGSSEGSTYTFTQSSNNGATVSVLTYANAAPNASSGTSVCRVAATAAGTWVQTGSSDGCY